jgi:hypothetical protein
MNTSEMKMAAMLGSVIVHLLEFIETGEPADMQAAKALLDLPDVKAQMDAMQDACLLPLKRQSS